jgi:hypothetical protein
MAKVYKNGPSKCQKHFRKSVDLNQKMRKHGFSLSGLMSSPANLPNQLPQYRDFTSVSDFQTLCNKVAAFKTSFECLPIDIKIRFKNSPSAYLDFMHNIGNPDDDKNTRKEAASLGLIESPDTEDEIKKQLVEKGVSELELEAAVKAEYEKRFPIPQEGK